MTTPTAILQDLMSGQSTADSISGRLRVPSLTIEAMLKRHQMDGLVEPIEIADGTLSAWNLTAKGRVDRQPVVKPFRKAPPIPVHHQTPILTPPWPPLNPTNSKPKPISPAPSKPPSKSPFQIPRKSASASPS